MPSKNDDENATPSDGAESTAKKKPTRRKTTSRLTRGRTSRSAKATATESAPADAQLELTPAPEPSTPSEPPPPPRAEPEPPRETRREPEPTAERAPEAHAREPREDSRHDAPSDTDSSPAPTQTDDSAPPRPQTQPEWQERGGDRGEDRGGRGSERGERGGERGDRGDRGDRGGDRGGRDFWKRNKRKRGRHGSGGGGHWQGGGGGPREQHPQQPPPPSTAPVIGELPNPARFEDLPALEKTADEISSGGGTPIFLNEIYAKSLGELTAFARELGVPVDGAPNKKQLLSAILTLAAERKTPIKDRGYIDVTDRGAFVVHEHVNYRLYPEDPYLPDSLIRLYGLKRGHRVEVAVQAPQPGERCPAVLRIESVMGMPPAEISKITPFEELVPYYPLQRILLESEETQRDVSMRAVDILTPIGFGQRALIVAPPRTGKTVLLQNIANSITANSPHAKLILLLIDERPEEVTDFRRHTKGEVVSSTFDETPESHVHCAEMVIENARRRVELGEHVVILLDSITRLARAYNALTTGGKTMSGGLESNALQKPKRFFGSARNIEGGGSLTIIASALIDTGSRMDEIIFEEFKGTGNCELHLDRGLVERRIFPAINIDRSGTRKEELIYHPEELQRIYGLRRAMQGLGPIESMEMLITRLKKTKSNAEFLLGLSRT